MRVPVKVVVNGVIDAAAVFAAKAEIDAGDAEVVEESGVVGTGAERGQYADRRAGALPGGASGECALRSRSWKRFHTEIFFSGSVMSLETSLTNFSSECEPSMEKAAAVAVGINVGGGVLLQFVGVVFGLFG